MKPTTSCDPRHHRWPRRLEGTPPMATPQDNKAFVLTAFDTLFNQRGHRAPGEPDAGRALGRHPARGQPRIVQERSADVRRSLPRLAHTGEHASARRYTEYPLFEPTAEAEGGAPVT
jgi:hypothetical protein